MRSLGSWLSEHDIPAICGVDTRAITKMIRESGTVLGSINVRGCADEPLVDPMKQNLVAEVSTKTIRYFGVGQLPRIVVIDCGIKSNIIRYLVNVQKVEAIVVPYNYDLASNPDALVYDGVFLSNGPGDPSMVTETIASVKWAINRPVGEAKPVFGICLGNQLMALAVGAKTFKMRYGNRSANQPCIDMRTGRCYITPQNHGYAVDADSLPEDWKTFFLNANDFTNEGIIHASKPLFAVIKC